MLYRAGQGVVKKKADEKIPGRNVTNREKETQTKVKNRL